MENLNAADYLLILIILQTIVLTLVVAYLFSIRPAKPKPRVRKPKTTGTGIFPSTNATQDL